MRCSNGFGRTRCSNTLTSHFVFLGCVQALANIAISPIFRQIGIDMFANNLWGWFLSMDTIHGEPIARQNLCNWIADIGARVQASHDSLQALPPFRQHATLGLMNLIDRDIFLPIDSYLSLLKTVVEWCSQVEMLLPHSTLTQEAINYLITSIPWLN